MVVEERCRRKRGGFRKRATHMIASGNILQDDLISEIARCLNLGFGHEVSELIFDRPQLLAEKASRALRRHIAYIGSNDFGEEIFRIAVEAETPASEAWNAAREPSCAPAPSATAAQAAHPASRTRFGALRRLFAA
jgi:hypothetical protein